MGPKEWIVGAVTTLLVGLALKRLPGLLASEESKLLESFLSQCDKDDQELILAMVKWADKKIPDGQQGHLKYQAVANMVTARFPLISAESLDRLIEEAVDKMKQAAEDDVAKGPQAGDLPPGAP